VLGCDTHGQTAEEGGESNGHSRRISRTSGVGEFRSNSTSLTTSRHAGAFGSPSSDGSLNRGITGAQGLCDTHPSLTKASPSGRAIGTQSRVHGPHLQTGLGEDRISPKPSAHVSSPAREGNPANAGISMSVDSARGGTQSTVHGPHHQTRLGEDRISPEPLANVSSPARAGIPTDAGISMNADRARGDTGDMVLERRAVAVARDSGLITPPSGTSKTTLLNSHDAVETSVHWPIDGIPSHMAEDQVSDGDRFIVAPPGMPEGYGCFMTRELSSADARGGSPPLAQPGQISGRPL
jgi:hypothetical protein